MLRHPLSAAFRFLAGHQLELGKKMYKTIKREWALNKHPRDVLFTLLLEHAPPAYLDRCLTIYAQLESWWTTNAKANLGSTGHGTTAARASAVGGAPAAAPPPIVPPSPS